MCVCAGGLDEALYNVIAMAREQEIPFVFALGRKALGRCVNKLVPVSVVGIFNFSGAEVHTHTHPLCFCKHVILYFINCVLSSHKPFCSFTSFTLIYNPCQMTDTHTQMFWVCIDVHVRACVFSLCLISWCL